MTCRAALAGDKKSPIRVTQYACQGGLQIEARRNVVQPQQDGKL